MIANEGKSPTKDKGPKEEPTKAVNGSEKPNGNSNGKGHGNGRNGGKWASNEPSAFDNKRPKGNRYEPRFTNYTALVESQAEVYQATS